MSSPYSISGLPPRCIDNEFVHHVGEEELVNNVLAYFCLVLISMVNLLFANAVGGDLGEWLINEDMDIHGELWVTLTFSRPKKKFSQ